MWSGCSRGRVLAWVLARELVCARMKLVRVARANETGVRGRQLHQHSGEHERVNHTPTKQLRQHLHVPCVGIGILTCFMQDRHNIAVNVALAYFRY
jgi:hypothetical protein